ncbi:MAG: pyridoxamine 5'-phosphate oxidase family protein [bacterium]|nr:pyridoxamine 5'-phosphate oxidase family protein [bacterium]
MFDLSAQSLRSLPSLRGTAPPLDLTDVPASPVAMFSQWLETAVGVVPEPLACTVSTVGEDGVPDSRVLIVKSVDEDGWAFAGTASSRKGRQLEARPVAAVNFWWQQQVRAVRLSGPVAAASAEECEADLAARSESARAGVPDGDWRLWRVRPTRVEFWQGAQDRRHVRIVYELGTEGWSVRVPEDAVR